MIIISFFNTSGWEKLLTPEERNNGQIVEIFSKTRKERKKTKKTTTKKKTKQKQKQNKNKNKNKNKNTESNRVKLSWL